MSDDLQHYGVKGMKWGVRRYQPYPKGSGKVGKFVDRAKQRRDVKKQEKIDKKYIKRTTDGSIANKIYNGAVHEMNNGGIEKFNKKWNDKKVDHLNDPKIRQEYYDDYEKEFQNVARKHAKAATTESPTGNIRTEYKYNPGSILPTAIHVVTEKGKNVIQQSDNDNVIVFKITHDSKGFIKKLIPEGEDTIKHYGVKGMKWGVRRFQPYPKGSKNAGKFIDSAKRKVGEAKSSINTKRKAASKKASVKRKAYHKKKTPESIYGRAYSKAKESGASETKAMKSARATEVITKAYMAKTVADVAMTYLDNKSYYKTGANVATNARKAAYLGKELSKVAGKQALNSKKTHDAVRFGKNIVQAAKRSPVRYVDGAAMKNVVNVGTDLMTR